jgi:hypothetical protein
MTEDTPTDGTTAGDAREDEDAPKTLGELSHTNPHTGTAFGATQTYDRGRTIAADGGEAGSEPTDGEPATDGGEAGSRSSSDASDGGEAGSRSSSDASDGGEAGSRSSSDASDGGETEDDADLEELQDIEHTPPGDAEGTNDVYERGHEGREENR